MLQFGVVLFGFAMIYVLMSAARNKREGVTNPRILVTMGYLLSGVSVGFSALLLMATQTAGGAATVLSLLS